MDLNIKRNNTRVYVAERNWLISMTYDYIWVPKIRIFEGNWIRKRFVLSGVNLLGVKESPTFLSNFEDFNPMFLLK